MADDPVAAELDAVRGLIRARDALVDRMRSRPVSTLEFNAAQDRLAGRAPALLAAVDAVLVPHAPRTDRVLGSSCFTHRNTRNSLRPVPGCGDCIQDGRREVCPECRDEFGDPVPFGDCRARKAVLAALKGENGG